MKHLAKIQVEFLKAARKWDDLSYDEQKGYLSRHPKTKRRLTARPTTGTNQQSNPMLKEGDIVEDYNGHRMTVIDSSMNFANVEKYDSTGAAREDQGSLDNVRYVAVKDDDGETYVYIYGDAGVTKIKDDEVSKAERVLRDGKIIKSLTNSNNWKWYKLDEQGKLWSANNDWNWTIDSKQKIPNKGYTVVGPQLQMFDTNGQNHYFKLTEEAPTWVDTGRTVPTGSYYGASQIFKPVYEYKVLPVGTEVQQLVGGTFAIIDGQRQRVRFTNPDSDPHPFEKQYGRDATKVQLPLSVMKQVDTFNRIVIRPKKLNIPEFGKKREVAEEPLTKIPEVKKKGFPKDEIIQSMKSLFRGQGDNYGQQPEAEDDSVRYGLKNLGNWIDSEEDDDYPEWSEQSEKKYTTEFKEWAKRQSWFDPKTMEAVVSTSEKRWVEFYIQKRGT